MSPTPSSAAKAAAAQKSNDKAQVAVVLGVALFFGLVASFATFRVLSKKSRSAAEAEADMVSVVVARQDLAPGTTVGRLNLDMAEWPREHIPQGSYEQLDKVVGRQVTGKIFRGEPVVETRLLAEGDQGGLQFRIPDGMLAMSLKVNAEIGVSGFIQPGNRVDVIATVRPNHKEPVTKVVLQNILVLAVGHEVEEKDDKPDEAATVTLAVSPEQAEKLAASKIEGNVVLALRNLRDDTIYETPGFSSAELVKIRRTPKLAAAAAGEADAEASEDGEESAADETDRPGSGKRPGIAAKPRPGKPGHEQAAPKTEQKVRVVELIQAGTVSEVKFDGP